jgi:opacity protein-like surface antigen
MKRISALSLIVLVLAASSASAAPMAGRFILTPKFGYVWMGSTYADETFNGYQGGISIERTVYGQSYALGFDVSYLAATDEFEAEGVDEKVKIDHTSIPIMATFKYMWSTTRWTLHLGLGLGAHNVKTEANVTWEKVDTWGMAMAFPVGLMFWPTENLNINASYQMNWLLDNALAEDRSTTIYAGVGFQF